LTAPSIRGNLTADKRFRYAAPKVCYRKPSFIRRTLYVFDPRNERFRDYLRKVREAAEEIEGPEFFKL